MYQFIGFTILIFATHLAHATDEFFGVFNSEPSFTVKSNVERPTFQLNKEFIFKDPNTLEWKVPGSTEVDGASIPKFAWSIVGGPMSGKFLHASIIHDYYCVTKERTAHDTHRNFYYGMRAKGVSDGKAKLMYWAVKTFGPDWILVPAPKFNDPINTIVKYARSSIDISELSKEKTDRILEFVDSLDKSLESSNGMIAPTVCQDCVTIEQQATLESLDQISTDLLEEIGLDVKKYWNIK